MSSRVREHSGRYIYIYVRTRKTSWVDVEEVWRGGCKKGEMWGIETVRKDGENVRVRLQQNTFMEHIRMLYIYY